MSFKSINILESRLHFALPLNQSDICIAHDYAFYINESDAYMYHLTNLLALLVNDQLSPTCTLLASAREFSIYFLQTTIINGDKSDSRILHLYLG